MNVLIVGSGGREHALAWKAAQSPLLEHLYLAPGNAGSASLGENVPLPAEEKAALVDFSRERAIQLVLIGPEAPLAAGLADDLRSAGIPAFGPGQAAARIEASKVFAKDFMIRHAIPTARYATFEAYDPALAYLRQVDYPLVIKASGLAAGKGVLLPDTPEQAEAALRAMLMEGEFGAAGERVVIEERLSGEEVSLLAFTDGRSVKVMPPAQDHKRLLDGDRGPNTGGMGAYAPASICPPRLVEELTRTVLQPAVDGLREEGCPFVGVLYAGLILTHQGPRVLEFNCRFGDPETQAILPLLESDLLEIAVACVEGRLGELDIRWKSKAAACIVLASGGYPGRYPSGLPISGLEKTWESAAVFHAGTRLDGERVLTAGGRVLGVTGWGENLAQALERVYQVVGDIQFEGMQFRKDIGARQLHRIGYSPRDHVEAAGSGMPNPSAYATTGVDIDAGNRAVELMKSAVRSTYGPQVLAGIGAFGGLFDAAGLQALQQPVLAASTDGVGTKVMLAAQAGSYATLGEDIVNHCINDILVQGARPLFFLDYIASAKLQPEVAAQVVSGIAAACREAGCALLGGETAEMPGVYQPGEFDIAGTIVGVVERRAILPRGDLQAGDALLGLRSSGPHTNGYSLIRKVFAGLSLDTVFPELGVTLAEALLAPHRSYLRLLGIILDDAGSPIKALAHITGGGFIDNIPRPLPEGLGATIRLGSWPVPPIFKLIQERGSVPAAEMYRVFNMGIGMVIFVAREQVEVLQAVLPEETWVIGELTEGQKEVRLV